LLKKVYTDPSGQSLRVSVVVSGRENVSIHRPQLCLVGQGFVITAEKRVAVDLPGRTPLGLDVLGVRLSGPRSQQGGPFFYAYWFAGCGKETPSHWARTWYAAWDRLIHHRARRWAYIAVSGPGVGDGSELSDPASRFIRSFHPMITKPREAP
jgi:hypothetical protein